MTGHDGSIYRICRDEAGLTQEEAAEKLNCSVRQLARYEAGEQRTPDDIANRMAVIYDSQLLKVQHLRLVSPMAADLLPPVIERGLGEVAMRITNRMRRFYQGEQGYRLLEIAEDNVVSPEEEPLYREIFGELLDIEQAIMELRISQEVDSCGTGERGVQGQSGADSGGVSRPGDPVPERDRPVATYGQSDGEGHLPDEGRRDPGRQLLDQRGQSGPGHVVGIKKERPEDGASGHSVQGLASENNRKIMIAHLSRKCKPRTVREEVNLR